VRDLKTRSLIARGKQGTMQMQRVFTSQIKNR
jgi:hypothetical protein